MLRISVRGAERGVEPDAARDAGPVHARKPEGAASRLRARPEEVAAESSDGRRATTLRIVVEAVSAATTASTAL